MPSDHTVVFETERLIIRPATISDANLFYDLWTNPQVMKNVGFPQGLRITHDDLKERLQSQRDETVFDRMLVVELKDTGQTIGECMMHRPTEEGIAEPDVKLLPAFWGHRYGFEVWEGVLTYLFTHTDCTVVQASPNVENIASIKMQEAVGAVRVGEDVYHFPESMRDYTTSVHCYIYHVYRADWEGEMEA